MFNRFIFFLILCFTSVVSAQSDGDTLFLKGIKQVNDSVVKIQIHIKSNKCDCWSMQSPRLNNFNKINRFSNKEINPEDTLYLPVLRYNLKGRAGIFIHDYKPHYS